MTDGIKVDGGNTLGKTIIFAKKHQHADFIRKRFNANYPHLKDQFLKVIDYREEYKHDLLNDFKQKNKMPQIACSVDMLDTGIDVPEVVNLVFLKPVKSSVKFWQMIGRGTRLCKNLFGYGEDKKEFLILDFCQNFEFFNEKPRGIETKQQQSLNEKLFIFRLKLSQLLIAQQDEENKKLGFLLVDYLHLQVESLYKQEKDSFIIRPHIKLIEKYLDRNSWNDITQDDYHELVTNIAPLVFDNDKDAAAKMFDLMMFDLMTSLINGEKKTPNIIEKVINISNKLMKQTSIPQVKGKLHILQQISNVDYWIEIAPVAVDKLREEIRDLIKFLEPENRQIVYTSIDDNIASVNESPAVFETNSFNKEAYKDKLEQFVKENQLDITIDKIRKNIKVTKEDISHLEKMLFSQGTLGSKEVFKEVYGDKPLGEFIRSVVGLDKVEAKNAFAKITNEASFNLKQMEFMNLLGSVPLTV